MTKPCARCHHPVDELGLVHGLCHGCRVEYREGQFNREVSEHVGFAKSKRWKGYQPSTTRGRREKLVRSTAKKLDALLDRLQTKH